MQHVRTLVAVVICGLLAGPAGASATSTSQPGKLLRRASHLSGLPARRTVPTETLSPNRYDRLLARDVTRGYPTALQRTDSLLYARLGLVTRSVNAQTALPRAWYDISARRLLLRRMPVAGRSVVLNELVRALIDQNYGLRRIVGLRARDRDRWLAARGIVDGTAALASGLRAGALRGTPLERFRYLESHAELGPGRQLAAQLRAIGGRVAVASALRTFPRTTEQLLHIDKFLEREPVLAVRLPARIGEMSLRTSETFGELDVRNLLDAFALPASGTTAEGWGGGRLALYSSGGEEMVAALVLHWDSPEDAAEWRDSVPRYVAAAFPGAAKHDCPPLDRCWSGPGEVSAGVFGTTSVLASGPGSASLAAALLTAG